jgi:hypothetical protein
MEQHVTVRPGSDLRFFRKRGESGWYIFFYETGTYFTQLPVSPLSACNVNRRVTYGTIQTMKLPAYWAGGGTAGQWIQSLLH